MPDEPDQADEPDQEELLAFLQRIIDGGFHVRIRTPHGAAIERARTQIVFRDGDGDEVHWGPTFLAALRAAHASARAAQRRKAATSPKADIVADPPRPLTIAPKPPK